MKYLFYILSSFIIGGNIISACSTEKRGTVSNQVNTSINTNQETNMVAINDIEGYFCTQKVDSQMISIFSEAKFQEYFHPAKTMTNRPTKVDFTDHTVVGIILPETDHTTTIYINSAKLDNKTLIIDYTIDRNSTKESYSTLPFKVFSFSNTVKAESIILINGITRNQVEVNPKI